MVRLVLLMERLKKLVFIILKVFVTYIEKNSISYICVIPRIMPLEKSV